jgi:hypothetical protein
MNAGGLWRVGQSVADIEIIKDTSGDRQLKLVIYQEGMGLNQATTTSGGNVLAETILQQLGFALA